MNSKKLLFWMAAIVFILLLIFGYDYLKQRPEAPTARINVSTADAQMMGSPDAPVTIVEFSDFQCPSCDRFYLQTLPQIEEAYIKTGKVKLYYKNFPIHDNSQAAAEAALSAGEQGKFWEYHNILYEKQDEWSADTSKLIKYANDLGLDISKFNESISSGKHSAQVVDDFNYGNSLGVRGTPTFYINGIMLVGAQPFSEFQKIIDEELAKQ
jgi:protein-disulfide isomerase